MKKKVIAIILICVVVALSAVAIVLNVSHKDATEVIAKPNIVYIYNQDTESNLNGYGAYKIERKNTAKIDELYSKFEIAFGSESNLHTVDNRKAGGIVGSIANLYAEDEYTVVFYYLQEQELKINDQTIKYQYLFFKVTNASGKNTVVFGVNSKAQEGQDPTTKALDIEDTSKKTTYLPFYYSYEANVNFGSLYIYISQMDLTR